MEPELVLFCCLVLGITFSQTTVHPLASGPPPLLDDVGSGQSLVQPLPAESPSWTQSGSNNETQLHFIQEPHSQVVANGGRAALACAVDSPAPDVTIEWLLDGQPVVPSRRRSGDGGALVIEPVKRRRDQGAYQCRAWWRHGALLSRPAQLTVASIARHFSVSPGNVTAAAGGAVLLRCQLPSVPPARLTWHRDGAPLNLSQRVSADLPGQLLIRQLRPSDAALYSCVGANSVAGRQRSSGAGALTVVAAPTAPRAPRLLGPPPPPPPVAINVTENASLVLPCAADGHPAPTVRWRRDDGLALPAGAETRASGALHLRHLQRADSGLYRCDARNAAGAASRRVRVAVLVPPTIVSPLAPLLERRPGRLIRLQCRAAGHPPPVVTWLKNSQRITADGRVRAADGELFISNMQSSDTGTYQCVVYNSVGYAATAVLLRAVRGGAQQPPPTALRASNVTARSALIQWNVSADITPLGYTVHFYKTNSDEPKTTVVVPDPKHWLQQLQPYTNYTVYVRTYTREMASDPSSSITLLTREDVPSQSPAVTLVAVSPTALNVSWEPLPAGVSNGVITGYRIISQRAGEPASAAMVQVDAARRSFLIEGLIPGREYDVRVLAATHAGFPAVGSGAGGDWVLQRMPQVSPDTARAPRPPHFNLVVTNHTTILITWSGSDSGSDSGSAAPAVAYVVTYRRQAPGQRLSDPLRLPGNTTQFHLTQLASSTFYEVHVRAVAADGQQAEAVKTISTLAAEATPVERPDTVVLEPPTGLQVAALNSSAARVWWQQPPSARTIQYFTVRYRPLGRDVRRYTRLSSTSRELTITGLDPYTYYEFSVRSHDAQEHFGPYSEARKVRTREGVPSAPLGVRWSAVDAARIQVQWQPPAARRGLPAGYRVLYSADDQLPMEQWRHVDVPPSAGTSLQLAQLVPNQSYWLVVRGRSGAGLGAPSPPLPFRIRAVLADEAGAARGDRDRQRSGPLAAPSYVVIVATVLLALVLLVLSLLLVLWWRRRRARRPPAAADRPRLNGACPSGLGAGAASAASEAHELEPLAPVLTHVPPAAANRQLDTKGGHAHPKPLNGRANGFVHPLYSTGGGGGGGRRDRRRSVDANESRLSLINNNASLLSGPGSSDHLPP